MRGTWEAPCPVPGRTALCGVWGEGLLPWEPGVLSGLPQNREFCWDWDGVADASCLDLGADVDQAESP